MTKTGLFLNSILLLIFFIGCGNTEIRKAAAPVNIEAHEVQNYNEGQAIMYNGTIEESESVPHSFATIGNVAKVLVAEGDKVRKGQLLATLDGVNNKYMYDVAKASLKQAEDAYNRLLPMYRNGTLPEVKFVDIETKLQQAKSMEATSKKNLDDCQLYSTVDGIVGRRNMEPGMSAVPNMTSIMIVKIEKVYARISVSENEISTIKTGGKARIKISALNNAEYAGSISEIGVLADPITHTYKIKIAIPNPKSEIKPGMICNAAIERAEVYKGFYIPSYSVMVDEQNRSFVFTLNSSKDRAIRKYVKTGKLLKNGVEILEGLNSGEMIVISGQQKLVDNSIINVINK